MGTKVCLLWPVLSCPLLVMGTKSVCPAVLSCVGHGIQGLFALTCLVLCGPWDSRSVCPDLSCPALADLP